MPPLRTQTPTKKPEPPSIATNILEPQLEKCLLTLVDELLTERRGQGIALGTFCEDPTLRVQAARILYREQNDGKEPLLYNWHVRGWTTVGHPQKSLKDYRTTILNDLSRYLTIYQELEKHQQGLTTD